jgi:hypothetical protein
MRFPKGKSFPILKDRGSPIHSNRADLLTERWVPWPPGLAD